MSRFRLLMWVIIGLFLGESLRQKLKEEGYELFEVDFNQELMEAVPDAFDARTKWPQCPTIQRISDQGSSSSSWAVSAADAMTDRICIHSLGERMYGLSAANLINCCVKCGDNLNRNKSKIPGVHGGGNHAEAWKYWMKNGIVTGGPYGSNESCQPYEFEPCKHYKDEKYFINEPRQMCKTIDHTPTCKHSCQPFYRKPYNMDKHYGKRVYRVKPNEQAIRTEIFLHGPVQASMLLYDNFKDYESGLYDRNNSSYSSMHAVRIIGWGHDTGPNSAYWIVANSYNTDWGENGFFRIRRGINECLIESAVVAGIPDFQPPLTPYGVMYKSDNIFSCWTKFQNFVWKILGLP